MNNNFMKIDFKQYQEEYVHYIENQELDSELKSSFLKILNEKDLNKRMELWINLKISLNQIKNLYKLANPFYLGFGNPEADILFIGKEKAFNITNEPESFLNESVNNLAQWELINNEKDNLRFNPKNPVEYYKEKYNHKIKGNGTWGFYKMLTQKIKSKENLEDDKLFENCFTTEINHIPSKKTKNERLISIRKEFLQKDDFFKSFKYVIIGAKGSVNNEDIKDIFGDNPIETNDFNVGNNKRSSFNVDIFKYPQQRIILCNQLSGATGWNGPAIENLIKTIKND